VHRLASSARSSGWSDRENCDRIAISDDSSDQRQGQKDQTRLAFSGCGAEASSTGATTAGCGGRREAEKIGRSCVTVNTESGIDHSGLPEGNDRVVCRLEPAFGLATGVTRPMSTLSGASMARSVEMTSSVEEVRRR